MEITVAKLPVLGAVFVFVGLIVTDLGVVDIGKYETYVEAFMWILIAGGLIADPTTDGFRDSEDALQYVKPRKKVDY